MAFNSQRRLGDARDNLRRRVDGVHRAVATIGWQRCPLGNARSRESDRDSEDERYGSVLYGSIDRTTQVGAGR